MIVPQLATKQQSSEMYESGFDCMICGEKCMSSYDIIQHMDEHMWGNKTSESFANCVS